MTEAGEPRAVVGAVVVTVVGPISGADVDVDNTPTHGTTAPTPPRGGPPSVLLAVVIRPDVVGTRQGGLEGEGLCQHRDGNPKPPPLLSPHSHPAFYILHLHLHPSLSSRDDEGRGQLGIGGYDEWHYGEAGCCDEWKGRRERENGMEKLNGREETGKETSMLLLSWDAGVDKNTSGVEVMGEEREHELAPRLVVVDYRFPPSHLVVLVPHPHAPVYMHSRRLQLQYQLHHPNNEAKIVKEVKLGGVVKREKRDVRAALEDIRTAPDEVEKPASSAVGRAGMRVIDRESVRDAREGSDCYRL
ncbi:hypothetical protein BJ165DRAFT_1410932 [Panaeolus papilionaceus]|nr:hypothetical protein BJ165DRAFT_1410932 [Panaeolus papilionaceus]